jgi:diacylglycerol kinase family enzyme
MNVVTRPRVLGDMPAAGSLRWAAAAALLTLAACFAVLLAGVIRNWAGVLLSLAAIVVAVTSGWSVVSRRGAVRVAALILLAISVGLLIWGLILVDLTPWRIVVLIALAAASVGSARLALPPHQPHRRPAEGAVAARQPVLIMNLRSGGGKAERFHLAEECRARGIEPIVLRPGDDLTRIAEDAVARGADVIGMAGGDGSQALVAAVAARHQIPHVVVPAGTRNHFALDLGLDRNQVLAALDAYSDGLELRVDLAEVNGRVFVNNASLGLYAKIVQSPEYRDAKLKTAAGLLPGILGPDAEPLDLRFTGPDDTEYTTAHMILVSNDPYQLDHIGGRGTRPRLDRGKLGVVAARISDATAARRFLALESAGQIRRFEGWLEWESHQFRVGSAGPVEIAIDGESLAMNPPLVFVSRPGALRVRVPRHAPGVPPAARALHLASRATVSQLAAIAAGKERSPPAGQAEGVAAGSRSAPGSGSRSGK